MDRELLLEIGVEELPASWLPGLTAQLADALKARLTEDGLSARSAPVETLRTPRRLTACVPELIERQEDRDETRHRPARVGGVRRRRPADDRRRWVRAEAGRGLRRARRRSTRRKGEYLVVPRAASRQARRSTCCPTSWRGAARPDVPEADALGRACSRTARASCCSAGRSAGCSSSTAAASCRSRSRAHAERRRARACRTSTSGAVTYGHRFLATSGRAGRAIKVRSFDEYQREADRELRHARRASSAAIASCASSRRTRAGSAAAPCCSSTPQAEALLEEVAGPRRVSRRSSPARSAPEFLDAAGRSADDDADPPSAFLPGGRRRRAR